MFSHLTDFAYRRSISQALGFYIAYFVLLLVVSFVLALVIAAALEIDGSDPAAMKRLNLVGNLVAIIGSVALSITVLRSKGQLSGKNYGMVFASFILSALVGGVLGMAVVAYLTTWENRLAAPEEEPALDSPSDDHISE